LDIRLISCVSPLYPPLLREIHNPPAFLYVQGQAEILRNRSLAVVGTRKASEYGRQVTNQLIAGLKSDHITIISGLAEGIDTAAHWAALHHGMPTTAVFGCGLDIIYPACNRKLSREILENGGALLSEYPLGMPPTQYTFPQRNRIVAGLSHGLLLVECDVKSGALITARLAVEEGRTVFAVPGNIFNAGSQGPATLLKHGAVPVTCVEDILQELHWETPVPKAEQQLVTPVVSVADACSEADASTSIRQKASSPKSLTIPEDLAPQERTVLEAISVDPISLDDLQQTTGLPSAKISGSLTLLELDGLVVLLPGARVCRRLT
jgi:DNA processing protein